MDCPEDPSAAFNACSTDALRGVWPLPAPTVCGLMDAHEPGTTLYWLNPSAAKAPLSCHGHAPPDPPHGSRRHPGRRRRPGPYGGDESGAELACGSACAAVLRLLGGPLHAAQPAAAVCELIPSQAGPGAASAQCRRGARRPVRGADRRCCGARGEPGAAGPPAACWYVTSLPAHIQGPRIPVWEDPLLVIGWCAHPCLSCHRCLRPIIIGADCAHSSHRCSKCYKGRDE